MKIKLSYILIALLVAVVAFVLIIANQQAISRMDRSDVNDGLSPPIYESMDEAPILRVEQTHFDMGVIPRDRNTTQSLRIFNDGKSPLEIKSLLTSCSLCTKAAMADGKKIIAPGSSALVEITMFPTGVYGFYSKKTLSIGSNDPRRPKVNIEVEAWVDPEFVLEPEDFDFGTIEKGEEAQATLRFRSLIDEPIQIKEVVLASVRERELPCPRLTLSYEPVPEEEWTAPGRNEYLITARVAPDATPGDFQESCFIETDLERFDSHLFFARGKISAPFNIDMGRHGNTINLTHLEQKVEGIIRAAEACTVTVEEEDDAFARVTVEQISDGEWKVVAETLDSVEPGLNQGSVTFVIDMQDKSYRQCVPIFVIAARTTS